jgi:hypothetical protein
MFVFTTTDPHRWTLIYFAVFLPVVFLANLTWEPLIVTLWRRLIGANAEDTISSAPCAMQ